MAATGSYPVADFDHNSERHSADPVASYQALRAAGPVVRSEHHGGYWILSGYQPVFEAARDDETFSSARTTDGGEGLSVVIPKTPMHFHIPIEIDPPEFRKWRKILNPITAPAAIERLERMVRHYVTWFIDDIIEQGECDLAKVIGVPSIVTVDWLGLDVADWTRYASAHHAVLAAVRGSAEWDQAVTGTFLTWRAGRGRSSPRGAPNLLRTPSATSRSARSTDGPITDDEVYSMVDLLLAGGIGTTASLVSNTLGGSTSTRTSAAN